MDKRTLNDYLYTGDTRGEERNAQGRLALENGCAGNDHDHHHHHHHDHDEGCHNRRSNCNNLLPLLLIAFLLFGNTGY